MQDVSGQLAATLEVIAPGVEVQRVNTVNWIAVQVEAIVGVGDVIRTDETGKARITFFADGVDTEIQPDSEFRIERFEGNNTSFRLLASLLLGQSIQRVGRVLDADSSYDIQTPGMELTVRGTEFVVRVEDSGRSAVLVTEGTAVASAEDGSADVSAGFGTRADANGVLSDVVVAASFDQLDAALDGCAAGVVTVDDVRLNVRLGPSIDFPRVGTADGADIDRFYGVSASGGWYRIAFSDNFGWVLASDTSLDPECAGLRVFPDTQAEDPALYGELGDAITLDDLKLPPATPPAPPETTGQGAG
jgi:hypothetical protein